MRDRATSPSGAGFPPFPELFLPSSAEGFVSGLLEDCRVLPVDADPDPLSAAWTVMEPKSSWAVMTAKRNRAVVDVKVCMAGKGKG